MAEKPEDLETTTEKITKAKELYGRGCRNYYVKSYSEAADDLSEASKLMAEAYGVDGDELGEVYLLYAKSLIAVGQEENKLIEVPEEEDEMEEDDGGDDAEAESNEAEAKETESGSTKGENGTKTNGLSAEATIADEEPQPGPSGSQEDAENDDENVDANDEEDGGNLEVAWEVLQNAAVIFEKQGERGLVNLIDVYIEMAEISLENGNFEAAIKDFNRAMDIYEKDIPEMQSKRVIAEVQYKIGLCQTLLKMYDEAATSFRHAADIISDVMEDEKRKEPQTDEVKETIKDLEETHQEILNKIIEIGDTKKEEIEAVKKELTKMFGVAPGSGDTNNVSVDGAGCSSSSASVVTVKSPEIKTSKPSDISHLIKRKKPDTVSDGIEGSPAKKVATECSPANKIAMDTSPDTTGVSSSVEKIADEVATVKVAVDN